MSSMESTSGEAREVVRSGFSQVVGLRAWDASIGVGSFLTIEFGKPRVTSVGVTQGSFHLWVYGSPWIIRERGTTIATSGQDRAAMMVGARAIEDAILEGFVFDPILMTLTLQFDRDVELALTPLDDPEMEEWILYLDDDNVIAAGPGATIIRERADVSRPLEDI